MNYPLSPALSDPFTLPVGAQTVQICPAMREQVIVYNNDLTNIAYVGYNVASGQGSTNTVPVQPLTQVVLDGRKGLYAFCPTATVSITVVPGGTYISPSPAQIALQIANSGAPPIAFSRNIWFTGFNIPLVVGSPYTVNLGIPIPITGTGYDFEFNCYAAASAYIQIDFSWTDSNGGETAHETWFLIPGVLAGGNFHFIQGHGPTSGVAVLITVAALSSNVNFTMSVNQNSRTYTRHDMRSVGWTSTNNSGSVAANDANTLTLLSLPGGSSSWTTGLNKSFLLPLYAGRMRFWANTSSATNDMTATLFNVAEGGSVTPPGDNPIWGGKCDTAGNLNLEFSLPRAQCQLNIQNNNAGTVTIRTGVIAEEY